MAEQPGQTNPVEPDPMDARLRELARDTEPLVVLAGPEAARRLGERRRARRRTGALSLAAAVLALAVGSWQFLPGLGGDDTDRAAPAASTAPPTVELATTLHDALLPPNALPLYPKWRWEVVPSEVEDKFSESCPAVPADKEIRARAERTYVDLTLGLVAHYGLYAMAGDTAAEEAATRLSAMVKAKCGRVVKGVNSVVRGNDRVSDAWVNGDDSGRTTVWIQRRGAFVAVLELGYTGKPPGGKSEFSDNAAGPTRCIARSLERLAPGTTLPAGPAGTAGGTGVGSGVGPGPSIPGSSVPGPTTTPTALTPHC